MARKKQLLTSKLFCHVALVAPLDATPPKLDATLHLSFSAARISIVNWLLVHMRSENLHRGELEGIVTRRHWVQNGEMP